MPELKSFLQDGEAASYKGVSIQYVSGRTAIMTIYKDGQEIEQVHLHALNKKAEMHAMMAEKGFKKMEESERQLKKTEAPIQEHRQEPMKRLQGTPKSAQLLQTLILVFTAVSGIGLSVFRKRRSKKDMVGPLRKE
jgi:hypothetical protein